MIQACCTCFKQFDANQKWQIRCNRCVEELIKPRHSKEKPAKLAKLVKSVCE